MGFLIGVLTAVLVLDCLFLMLLILIQLPKKEAGVGTAFGGAATDALFGAGSGNALTQLTKYAAAAFFVLAFGLAIIGSHRAHLGDRTFKEALQTQASSPAATKQTPSPAPSGSTNLFPGLTSTNLVPPAASNAVEGAKAGTNVATPPRK
jgi:protein translocase SecG subunit